MLVAADKSADFTTLEISTPANGEVFTPGHTFQITVNGSADIQTIAVMLSYNESLTYYAFNEGDAFEQDFTIDSMSGIRTLYSIGKSSSGEMLIDSISIHVCPDFLSIDDPFMNTGAYYAGAISSTSILEDAGRVEFTAGQLIRLTPGFRAQAGTNFHARIAACGVDNFSRLTEEIPHQIGRWDSRIVINEKLKVFPNPTGSMTTIQFDLAEQSRISLTLNDLTGRPVKALTQGIKEAGNHRIFADLSNNPPGYYLLTLRTKYEKLTRKVLIIR